MRYFKMKLHVGLLKPKKKITSKHKKKKAFEQKNQSEQSRFLHLQFGWSILMYIDV